MPYADPQKRAEAQKRYREKRKERGCSKTWLFVFYPESAPEDWKRIIGEWMVECIVSPLHDKDVNANGEPKKPHWHGILHFANPKTFDDVKTLIEPLNGPIPIIPNGSLRSASRYLLHLDNPDKAQYNRDDLTEFAGAEFAVWNVENSERYQNIREMMLWCEENEIDSYAILLKYASQNNDDWFRCLCDNGTYVMKEYIKASKNDRKGR